MAMRVLSLGVVLGCALSGAVAAAVSEEEASQLGDTLTLWGAVKAGNADGSIPAYTGGIGAPSNYDPARPGIRPDPFADEVPVLIVDASNYLEHKDRLTSGSIAMFEKYPEFKMQIYPTHRTARYPEFYLKNAVRNATSCSTAADGLGLVNCYAGAPFPIPKAGVEVMWNQYMKFSGAAYKTEDVRSVVVDRRGTVMNTNFQGQWNQYPLWVNPPEGMLQGDEVHEMIFNEYTGPARKSGEKLILHDSLDMANNPRRAWSYLPGQRRVKLAPDVAYDTPSSTAAGIGTIDDSMVWFGAFDRYNWELVGKQEVYLPYNMFKLYDKNHECNKDSVVLTKSFMNPECVRWELHRAWVVKASLKEGARHIYPERTFYWDEDFLGVGMSTNYDSAGAVFRVVQSESIPKYESYGHNSGSFVTHDLASGAYARQAYSNGDTGLVDIEPLPSRFFSPQSMSAGGVR